MATTIRSTALDFTSIKNNLKTYLANSEEFKDYNFEASGLSNILDVLAHNTHVNSLVANFALNESFLGTAQLRSSVVSLAEGVGYVPDTVTSSQANVRVFFTTSTSPREAIIPLPAFTKFSTSVDDISYTFQTIETYYATDDGTGFYDFKTSDGSNSLTLYEGTRKTKTFLVGEYIDNPVYIIPDTTIDADTAIVRVYTSSTSSFSTVYQNIQNATSISASSTIYILKEAPNGFYELSFGDGATFGIAPAAGSRIEVDYISTKGAVANGAVLFSPVAQLTSGNVTETLSATTITGSVGGDSKESIESIRKNAPFRYATQNRMVTSEDYASLILRNFSTLIKDIIAWGGQDDLSPEFGAVFVSILFEDNVNTDTQAATKLKIIDLANQLSIISFNLRFSDPVTTFIEQDTYFQFNPNLTDETINSTQDSIRDIVAAYFAEATGKFGQAYRRSNLLAKIDEYSGAVLSSRADVRMQQRFTPTSPNLISVINSLTNNVLSDTQLNYVVELVTQKKYNNAASYLTTNNLATSNYTVVRATLAGTSINNSTKLRFPAGIAAPDDDTYIVSSNPFTFDGQLCILSNKLSSNTIQILNAARTDVIKDNVGSYDAGSGIVDINYFNPSSISGGQTQIKLSVVPANQSALAPLRNDLLVFDPDRSKSTGITVTANN